MNILTMDNRNVMFRILAILIVCELALLTSCSKEGDGEYRSSTDDEQPQKVTRWECILFGSYPANEVVSGSFNAVDDYALVDGDVITDATCIANWSRQRGRTTTRRLAANVTTG